MIFKANLAPAQGRADESPQLSCRPLGTSRDRSAPSCQAIPTFRPNYSAYRGERNDNSWQGRFAGLTYWALEAAGIEMIDEGVG